MVISAVSTKDGYAAVVLGRNIYTFGNGEGGQLGHGDTRSQLLPKRIDALADRTIKAVSSGENHTVVVATDFRGMDEVYTFGVGDYGQLGHGNSDNQLLPRRVNALADRPIKAISAGASHTVVVTINLHGMDEVYTFGCGLNDQLGYEAGRAQLLPRRVDALAGRTIKAISAGGDHTVVVATTDLHGVDEVYTFGSGDYGQLGHGDLENQQLPKRVDALAGRTIKAISAGRDHTIVVATDLINGMDEVYTFGSGDCGQLGHGDIRDRRLPERVNFFVGRTIKSVSAGHSHTLVVTTDAQGRDEIYAFGSGEHGRLGHGDTRDQLLPRRVDALAGKNITAINAGYNQTVIVADGQVYTFGNGEDGQLGHGDTRNQLLPRRVDAISRLIPYWNLTNGEMYSRDYEENSSMRSSIAFVGSLLSVWNPWIGAGVDDIQVDALSFFPLG